jgi:hypothetical protein
MDRFTTLLANLGTLINVPLHPDHRRLCAVVVNGKLPVQIKEDENKERLRVSAFLSEVPPGKFRERILIEALKENDLFPRLGTFSYCHKNNQLTFCSYVSQIELHEEEFIDFLEKFLEKAFAWKTGIETGQLPHRAPTVQKAGPSIFDVQKK